MDGKRILVTGGAGFIGSNLANALSDRNDVIVVDDESLGTREHLVDAVDFRRQSVLDDNLPTDVDIVYHLAAMSSYPMHEDNPQRGVRVNVEGFVNTVEQARHAGCDRIVYASTSSMYDGPEPSSEDVRVSANTAYEASKLARERYAEYVEHHYGTSIAGLRLFSVYQGYERGEDHKGEYANVIAQFAQDIAQGTRPVVYGDGEQTRDFVHVDDVVDAFTRAGSAELTGIYNVGTGQSHSFNEVIDLLNQTLDTAVEPRYIDNPIPDHVYVHDTCADASTFEAATGWSASIDLVEGVRRVCDTYITPQTP